MKLKRFTSENYALVILTPMALGETKTGAENYRVDQ